MQLNTHTHTHKRPKGKQKQPKRKKKQKKDCAPAINKTAGLGRVVSMADRVAIETWRSLGLLFDYSARLHRTDVECYRVLLGFTGFYWV